MSANKLPQLPAAFQRLAWSNLVAQSADQIALAAAPIVAVFSLGVAEGKAGLLQTALTLPFVLFAIPAGLMSDRMSRPMLMAGAEALRAAALFATLLLLWTGLLNLTLLALLGAVAVCGTVAYSVAAPSLVPSLVTQDRLATANARIELARTIAFAGGPALGGLLVGWVGAAAAFALAAATVGRRDRAAWRHQRAAASTAAAARAAARNPRRRRVRVRARHAATGLHHAVHLQYRVVRDPLGVRAICGAASRPVAVERRRHSRHVWRRHGDRRARCRPRPACHSVRRRGRHRPDRRLPRLGADGGERSTCRRRCSRPAASSCSAPGRSCG